MSQRVDIILNKYLEPVKIEPQVKDIDNVNEINVYVTTDENLYNQKVLTIINYVTHVKAIEYYESPLGEVKVEKMINVKPTEVLKLLKVKL